jgi:hypothetical protein
MSHSISYHTSLEGYEPGGVLPWHARCVCGERSDRGGEGVDGTMDSARRWGRAHLDAQREQGPLPPGAAGGPPALDEPDPALDSYDAFLRGVTREG